MRPQATEPAARRLRLRAPDLVEWRKQDALLVWRDVPAWAVVDRDLYAFLQSLDGSSPLDVALGARSQDRECAQAAVESLAAQGVFEGLIPSRGADATLPPIESVAVNLTRRCNLRCRFCYLLEGLGGSAVGELTVDETGAFLRSLRPFLAEAPALTLLGGEPTLAADRLIAIAREGRRQGFVTLASTNGTLIDDALAGGARDVGLQVQVSLDGHTAELHDAVRGQGSFERTIAGIRTLVRHCAHTILSMVCHEGNLPHLGDFYALALSLGVREARYIPLKRMGGALRGGFDPASTAAMVRAGAELLREHPEYRPLAGRDCLSILANTCRYSARRRSCGTGLQTVLLDADGSIYPCLNTVFGEFRVGNLRDAGFEFARAWRESEVLARVREGSRVDSMNPRCAACAVRHWCLGGCRGEAYAACGEVSAPPPNCADLRQAVLETFWVLAESPDLVRPATRVC